MNPTVLCDGILGIPLWRGHFFYDWLEIVNFVIVALVFGAERDGFDEGLHHLHFALRLSREYWQPRYGDCQRVGQPRTLTGCPSEISSALE